MRLLATERELLEHYLPGLADKLAGVGLLELEKPGNPGLDLFRSAGGAGLVVPSIHGGGGASALDAVRVTRALAVLSPSLAVAGTMHHFSAASLIALAASGSGPEWMLLDGIARDQRLLASGFAEGRTSTGILAPAMRGRWDEAKKLWLVSGRKQPCSLSRSMDLLTASVDLTDPDGPGPRIGIALIPAASPGLSVQPFWNSWALAGAESDTVVLADVEVHPDLMIDLSTGLDGELDDLQTLGFVWFELLATACYLGVATALVERVLERNRGPAGEQLALAMSVHAAATTLDAAATALDQGQGDNDALAHSLITRFTVADTIREVVPRAVELLGGMAYIGSSEVAYLAAASHAIGFHPPSRTSVTQTLLDFFHGRPVVID